MRDNARGSAAGVVCGREGGFSLPLRRVVPQLRETQLLGAWDRRGCKTGGWLACFARTRAEHTGDHAAHF